MLLPNQWMHTTTNSCTISSRRPKGKAATEAKATELTLNQSLRSVAIFDSSRPWMSLLPTYFLSGVFGYFFFFLRLNFGV